jgi:hypothetical protein
MRSISRSLLLTASLLALPLAGAVAQAVDTGKSTGPSSATARDKSAASKSGDAMKSTAPGYQGSGEPTDGAVLMPSAGSARARRHDSRHCAPRSHALRTVEDLRRPATAD